MADSDNLFDAAIARADETIRGYMGTSATMTSGEQSGAVIRGVFDDCSGQVILATVLQ